MILLILNSIKTHFINNTLNILKHPFTLVINLSKCFKTSYYISKNTKRVRKHSFGMPLALSIEPTTACNLRMPGMSKWT